MITEIGTAAVYVSDQKAAEDFWTNGPTWCSPVAAGQLGHRFNRTKRLDNLQAKQKDTGWPVLSAPNPFYSRTERATDATFNP
jgi:hypothetical protein